MSRYMEALPVARTRQALTSTRCLKALPASPLLVQTWRGADGGG
jgi:hypothetical protein